MQPPHVAAAGTQKLYCATTEQVWALHDAMPDHLRVAVLLGAFAGLRLGEVSRTAGVDVDFTGASSIRCGRAGAAEDGRQRPPVPIPRDLALLLAASVQKHGADMMVTNGRGDERGVRARVLMSSPRCATPRSRVVGLPDGFSFHDLRHYLASLLIASGADIKTVQARLRHASASTTLDVYRHLWPDADESTRTAIGAVIAGRPQQGMA